MKAETMNAKLAEELRSIPRGVAGSGQNALRMVYTAIRRHQLSEDPRAARSDAIARAVEETRRQYPGLQPDFDEAFFRPGTG